MEPQVFDLLWLLLERSGTLVSRDEMIAEIWDGRVVSDAAIDARVAAARKAVGDDGKAQSVIRTVPRRGLMLVAPVEADDGLRDLPNAADPPPTRSADPNRPSIAVRPFRALDSEPLAASLGEGLAEDTIIELSRASELFVVTWQSSFGIDPNDRPEDVGRTLCVRFVLAGTVCTAGNRLRVTAHLIRCQTGEEIWVERFDRTVEEVFDVQTEIARTVTATVVGRIAAVGSPGVSGPPSRNLAAYDQVLAGIRAMHRYNHADMESARDCFRTAAELDPDYARPFGLMAMTEIYIPWYYLMLPDFPDALAPAKRAVELDERETKGHCALGIIRMANGQHDLATRHFETGLQMNPNDDLLLIEYARFLLCDDRPEEGVEYCLQAMRLYPLHPNWYWHMLGRCQHALGMWDEALANYRRVTNPAYYALPYMAACEAMAGRPEAAAEICADLFRQNPEFDLARYRSVFPYRNPETLDGFRIS